MKSEYDLLEQQLKPLISIEQKYQADKLLSSEQLGNQDKLIMQTVVQVREEYENQVKAQAINLQRSKMDDVELPEVKYPFIVSYMLLPKVNEADFCLLNIGKVKLSKEPLQFSLKYSNFVSFLYQNPIMLLFTVNKLPSYERIAIFKQFLEGYTSNGFSINENKQLLEYNFNSSEMANLWFYATLKTLISCEQLAEFPIYYVEESKLQEHTFTDLLHALYWKADVQTFVKDSIEPILEQLSLEKQEVLVTTEEREYQSTELVSGLICDLLIKMTPIIALLPGIIEQINQVVEAAINIFCNTVVLDKFLLCHYKDSNGKTLENTRELLFHNYVLAFIFGVLVRNCVIQHFSEHALFRENCLFCIDILLSQFLKIDLFGEENDELKSAFLKQFEGIKYQSEMQYFLNRVKVEDNINSSILLDIINKDYSQQIDEGIVTLTTQAIYQLQRSFIEINEISNMCEFERLISFEINGKVECLLNSKNEYQQYLLFKDKVSFDFDDSNALVLTEISAINEKVSPFDILTDNTLYIELLEKQLNACTTEEKVDDQIILQITEFISNCQNIKFETEDEFCEFFTQNQAKVNELISEFDAENVIFEQEKIKAEYKQQILNYLEEYMQRETQRSAAFLRDSKSDEDDELEQLRTQDIEEQLVSSYADFVRQLDNGEDVKLGVYQQLFGKKSQPVMCGSSLLERIVTE